MAVLQAVVNTDVTTLSATAGQKIICISSNRSGATTFGVTPNPTGSTWVNRLVAATLPTNDEARRSLAIAELQVGSNFTDEEFTAAWNTGGASCIWLRVSEGYPFAESISANSGTSGVTAQVTGTTSTLSAGDVLAITGLASRGGWATRSWDTADIDPDVGGSPVELVADADNNEFANACAAGYLSLSGQSAQTYADEFNAGSSRLMTAGIAVWIEESAGPVELASTSDSISNASGTLIAERPLAGATDSISNATGTLVADRPLAGTADSVSDASGTLIADRPLAGATDSVSDASGVLATELALAGTTDSASSATGELVAARDLAGATDSVSDAVGTLEATTALAGATDSASFASGELSISGQADLASVSTSVADASGNLSGELALAGTADSVGSGTATLSIAGQAELEGATLETGGASGSLSGPVQLEGATDATDGATGQLTVSGEVKRDTMVLPIARDLLACLCEAVAEAPNPPASCCLRPGVTVAQGVSEREDECCEGLAWVRVSRVFPTGDEAGFPNVNEQTSACNPPSHGIELEMGVYRCAPTGDERNLPTCDEWTTATEQILDDAASMRRAWCCFRDNYANDAKLIGQWTPVEVQGGCTGGKMTIMIESYCTDCVDNGS